MSVYSFSLPHFCIGGDKYVLGYLFFFFLHYVLSYVYFLFPTLYLESFILYIAYIT